MKVELNLSSRSQGTEIYLAIHYMVVPKIKYILFLYNHPENRIKGISKLSVNYLFKFGINMNCVFSNVYNFYK